MTDLPLFIIRSVDFQMLVTLVSCKFKSLTLRNSILQCMFATPDLSKPFISGSYESEINSSSKTKGSLSRAYSELVKSAKKEGSVSSYLVRDFKSIVAKYNSTFDGYGQQDAQEFLRFALDGLS